MRRKNVIVQPLLMVIITLSMLVVFSEQNVSKPTDAGFWLIFAFGMSVGVALCQVFNYYRQKKKE